MDTTMDSTMNMTKLENLEELGHYQLDEAEEAHMLVPPEVYKALEILSFTDDDRKQMLNATAMTLLQHLNRCRTKDGQHILRYWLQYPLVDVDKIAARHEVVGAFCEQHEIRQLLHDSLLRQVSDVGSRAKRLDEGKATLDDLYKLYHVAFVLPQIEQQCRSIDEEAAQRSLANFFMRPVEEARDHLAKFIATIEECVDVEHAETSGECRLRANKDPNLYELANRLQRVHYKAMDALEKVKGALPCEIGIDRDVRRGYYYRVTIKYGEQVRDSAKKFTVLEMTKGSGVKFTDQGLQELNQREDVIGVLSEYKAAETAFVQDFIQSSGEFIQTFKMMARAVGELDVLVAFSVVATSSAEPYCHPQVLEQGSGIFELEACRHPVVEVSLEKQFIANDVKLDAESGRFVLLMGANMGGKSTYLRSAALAVFMAQVGSFVACSSARFSAVDGIFTRVGADDDQERGVSTFKAEMDECATILRKATRNSFVIIDELGRGTSTDDGFGLAFAIAEDIIKRIGAFTLFATHFHELVVLRDLYPNSVATRMMDTLIDETSGELEFLYQVVDGVVDKSLGIKIARMVGFPPEVVKRAESILQDLEGSA